MDVIRGVALLGILVVNMNFFGKTAGRAILDPSLASASFFDQVLWWFESTFFTGKFISLFSLLFGAGLALQMSRLDRAASRGSGRATWAMILRRLGILAFVGLLHALLIWYGDILFFYALLGWILIPLRHLTTRALAVVAAVLLTLSLTCMSGMGMLQVVGHRLAAERAALVEDAPSIAEEADGATKRERLLALIQDARAFDPQDEALQALETEIYREGGFFDALALRSLQWSTLLPVMLIVFAPHILGFFALGMLAVRIGFFRPESTRAQGLAMLIGLPLGILFCGGAGWLQFTLEFQFDHAASALSAPMNELGTIFLAIGYAGALARLTALRFDRSLILPLIAGAGRMAFTVYIAESILMTGLMYWWGFGRFGDFSRLEHMGIALGTWTLLLFFSALWFSRFRMGPLEWLWRTGTYLELPRLVR